jgi:pyruvate,water dikinase
MANLMATINTTLAEMLVGNDLEPYRMDERPKFLRYRSLFRHLPRILWKMRTLITSVVKSMLKPKQFLRTYDEAIDNFDEWLSQPIDFTQPLKEQVMESYLKFWEVTEASTYPALIFFMYANATIKQFNRSATPGTGDLVDAICRGYPDDQIVQMGLMMFDLSKSLPKRDYEDLEILEKRLQTRSLDPIFLSQWDVFIQRFGCRGPLEMEWANPKYGEQPRLALQQIAMIANAGGTFDPHEAQRQLIAEREQAYDRLGQLLPKRKRKRLAKAYKSLLLHSRSRELIKHHIMQVFARFRTRVLCHADQLVREGRLDTREQIFDVHMSEIDRALHQPDFDIRASAIARGSNFHKLQARVKHFPMAIDSRGRILRPQKKTATGIFKGAPISPGTITGPIKVLNNPFEKDIEPGDILTAVTTDPGWTPLFINAAAVILEIGGELQHGALVAREYGKPCVAGIPDVTNLLHDGQVVEVDGSAGTVRVVDDRAD